MKSAPIYSVSRVLGVFPFNRLGLSKRWLFISASIHLIRLIVGGKHIMILLHGKFNVTIKILSIMLVSLTELIPVIHTFHGCFKICSFGLIKPTLSQKMPYYYGPLIANQLISYVIQFRDIRWVANNSLVFTVALICTTLMLCLIRLQYSLYLCGQTKRIEKLKHRVGTFPMACCIKLEGIISQVEEVHSSFSWSLGLLFFTFLLSLSSQPTFMYDSPLWDDALRVLATTLSQIQWAILIVHSCSRLNHQIRSFYTDLFNIIWANDILIQNKRLVLYLKLQKTVNFSIFGLFTLGYHLIGSVVTAATSFFILFIQTYDLYNI